MSSPVSRRSNAWVNLLRPDWHARSLMDVTPSVLASLGVEGVMLDLDNTLTEWNASDPSPEARQWVQSLHDAGIRTCVVSNTHRIRRLRRLCEAIGSDYVLGVSKPRRKGFRLALAQMALPAEKTAIVGDQIFTDILGGNRMGIFTILVPQISPRELITTRWVSRGLERVLFSFLRRINRLPSRDPTRFSSSPTDPSVDDRR